MSIECIRNCPRILEIINEMQSDNLWSGPMAIHPDTFAGEDETGIARLLDAVERSYNCPGPTIEAVSVIKGVFRKRTVVEQHTKCNCKR